jgi:hypothetical protein
MCSSYNSHTLCQPFVAEPFLLEVIRPQQHDPQNALLFGMVAGDH